MTVDTPCVRLILFTSFGLPVIYNRWLDSGGRRRCYAAICLRLTNFMQVTTSRLDGSNTNKPSPSVHLAVCSLAGSSTSGGNILRLSPFREVMIHWDDRLMSNGSPGPRQTPKTQLRYERTSPISGLNRLRMGQSVCTHEKDIGGFDSAGNIKVGFTLMRRFGLFGFPLRLVPFLDRLQSSVFSDQPEPCLAATCLTKLENRCGCDVLGSEERRSRYRIQVGFVCLGVYWFA